MKPNRVLYGSLVFTLSALVLLSACSSRNSSPPYSGAGEAKEFSQESMDSAANHYEYSSESSVAVNAMEEKIIKKADISIETAQFDQAAERVSEITESFGGFVENSNISLVTRPGGDVKQGYFQIRVPVDHFDTAEKEISLLGKVTSSTVDAQNATFEYYDLQKRLDTKLAEEARLLAMIDKTTDAKSLIALEEMLADCRAQIELYRSQMTGIDRAAAYSTISLSLFESKTAAIADTGNFWSEVSNAFIASVNFVISFFQWAVIILSALILPALLIGTVVLVFWLVYKRGKKNNNKKAAKNNKDPLNIQNNEGSKEEDEKND